LVVGLVHGAGVGVGVGVGVGGSKVSSLYVCSVDLM
jgi:hypothetical protein